jgi:hypothetical protein
MDLDEALHAARGLDVASALRRGSLPDLWYETVKPHWYPPAHGYLLGAWFLLVGASLPTARLYATLCYALFCLLLWVCAKQVFPKIHPLFYLTPTLFLLSDNQHMVLSSMSMLELPANLLAFTSLYFFVQSLEKPGRVNTLLASIFALLCFLTRYGQGVMLISGMALTYLLFLRRLRGHIVEILLGWLPVLLLLSIWLVVLGEWKSVLAYANVQPGGGQAWSLESLLFYLRQLVGESSGWLPILVTLACALLWMRRRNFPSLAIPYLMFMATTLIVLSYRSNHLARFGTTLFPPLWILSAGSAAGLLDVIGWRRVRHLSAALWLIFLLLLGLKNLRSLPMELHTAYENTNTGVNDAYQFIADTVVITQQDGLNLVMYGETDSWNSFALHFYLQSQCMEIHPKCLVTVAGERVLAKGFPPQNTTDEIREAREQAALAAADYVVVFAKTPVLPDGWVEVRREAFLFTRHMLEPVTYQVVVASP